MGFFDSVLPGDKAASAGGQASTASTVVAEVAAPVPAATADSDFLIIDESVTVANVPDTVAEPTAQVTFSEPASDLIIIEDAPATETPVSDSLVILDSSEAVAAAPAEETAPASVLDFSSMSSLSVAPAIESEIVVDEVPATEAPIEESAPITGFLSVVSEEASAPAEEVQASPASSSLDPEDILRSSISQLESVVSAKESARDAEMKKAEDLNAQIAELKKQAKEAQESAREIDAGADRARSLITSLKSQIKAAA